MNLLGRTRIHLAQDLFYSRGLLQKELDPENFHLVWIVDFPMFEKTDPKEEEEIIRGQVVRATHHPFTAVHEEDALKLNLLLEKCQHKTSLLCDDPLIVKQLLEIKAQHFDLVCNGWELGGGSIRIHSADIQTQVFEEILHLPKIQRQSFDHLVQALGHGAPPHGGLAIGLDRLVAQVSVMSWLFQNLQLEMNS